MMSTNISQYRPHRVGSNERNDPQIQATVTAAFDLLKKNHPRRYKQIEQQRAYVAAEQPELDAMLDDPSFNTLFHELEKSVAMKRNSSEYALLGIELGATKRDIRNAYRRKARKMHPDAGGSDELFKQLQDAYHKLLKVAPKE